MGGALVNLGYAVFLLTKNRSWNVLLQNGGELFLAVLIGVDFSVAVALMGKGMLLLGALGASVGFGIQQAMQMTGTQLLGFRQRRVAWRVRDTAAADVRGAGRSAGGVHRHGVRQMCWPRAERVALHSGGRDMDRHLVETLQQVGKPPQVVREGRRQRSARAATRWPHPGTVQSRQRGEFLLDPSGIGSRHVRAAAFFAGDQWHNSGGDRTWLAPEVDFFFPNFPRTDVYWQPRQLDPGALARGADESAVRALSEPSDTSPVANWAVDVDIGDCQDDLSAHESAAARADRE